MSDRRGLLQLCKTICLVLTLGVSMNASGFGGDSWKEEVLLHDGSTIIVKRSQSYGGRHEIGQPPPIKEHTITFMLPNARQDSLRGRANTVKTSGAPTFTCWPCIR